MEWLRKLLECAKKKDYGSIDENKKTIEWEIACVTSEEDKIYERAFTIAAISIKVEMIRKNKKSLKEKLNYRRIC